MPNHLIDSSSPYLLQHANNPVEWYPWGAAALERAQREDKPIFLSVGYAACHWCHVMEHQSFENREIAAVMNEHFVNIKVDREERPDLDDLYMLATQLMTGQGGWPMSVWLTPDLKPFYAGTYFPPTDGYGRPGFPRLLQALSDAWKNRRTELLAQSDKVVEAIHMHADESAAAAAPTASTLPTPQLLRLAIEQFSDRFDRIHGGLGSAPKFPPHQALQLWLAILQVQDPAITGISASDQRILAGQLALTLDAMKNGGIYDHIGGAFARYSTDERWLVPHFEKMLYDSAQLAPVYAQASITLQNPDYARIARETLDFFLREMCSPEGAFYSSLDADSEGEEGKYYVWTADDVRRALVREDDAALMLEYLGIGEESNWHESPVASASVPAVGVSLESLAEKHKTAPQALRARISTLLETLRVARERRPRPGLDDKILTSWNGLMLSALAICGRVLPEPRYLDAASRLAEFLLNHHFAEAGLQRVSRRGAPAHTLGFLDDHAFFLQGLLDILQARPGDGAISDAATRLAKTLCADFQDARGGFFFTGPRHEQLFARMKNAADNATPSANGVAIRALFRLAARTGNAASAAARAAVESFRPALQRRPEYFPTILLALLEEAAAGGPGQQVAAAIAAPAPAASQLKLTCDPPDAVHADSDFHLTFHIEIPSGYHIQPATLTGELPPTTLRVRTMSGAPLAMAEALFPPPQEIHQTMGYVGSLTVRVRCRGAPEVRPGPLLLLRAILTAQLCTDRACLFPESLAIDLKIQIAET